MEREEVVRIARKNLEEGERQGNCVWLQRWFYLDLSAACRRYRRRPYPWQILIAGFSGVIAGAISMTIGAYISSKSEIEYHQSEIERENLEIEEVPEIEREEIRQ